MAIIPESQFPGKTEPASAEFPYGKARNITLPSDGTGTPWKAALANDIFGFQQALLSEAAIVPSGTPDQVGASQYLQALFKSSGLVKDDYTALRLVESDQLSDKTNCFITNGGTGGAFVLDKTDVITTDDGGITIVDADGGRWERLYSDNVNAEWFGASISAIGSVNTSSFQATINYVNSLPTGGVINYSGEYVFGSSGLSINGREYALLLKSGVTLNGNGMYTSSLKVENSSDIDLINTDRSAAQSNIGITNTTLDGNEANQGATPANGFNAWLYDVDGLLLKNIYSLNPASWGIRPERCDNVHVSNIRFNHSNESNSDGIHFVDCDNVTGGQLYVKSQGDDAFIIEVLSRDASNYTLHGIYAEASTGAPNLGRGVLLILDEIVATGAWTLSNINITGVVANDCYGPAISLNGASFDNVHIQGISTDCREALYLAPGNATNAGTLNNCSFDVDGKDTKNTGITIVDTYATFNNNNIDALVSNPADGYSGVIMRGDDWSGSIKVDYDPLGTKVTPLFGIIINDDNNDLHITCKGADTNLLLQGTAQNNNITFGKLSGAITTELNISGGSTGNSFSGGRISGAIINSGGITNKFNNIIGATGYGNKVISPDVNGNGTIAHGVNGTPTHIAVGMRGDTANDVDVQSIDGTNITVRIKDAAGADVTAGSFTIDWEAKL